METHFNPITLSTRLPTPRSNQSSVIYRLGDELIQTIRLTILAGILCIAGGTIHVLCFES